LYSVSDEISPAVLKAKALFSDFFTEGELSIEDAKMPHNGFCLWRASNCSPAPLRFTDVVIEGFPIDEYEEIGK
jgi:hypothetical protein